MIRFSDGVVFNTSGPLRIERKRDGLYLVGEGMLIPVESEAETREIMRTEAARSEATWNGLRGFSSDN